MDFTDLVHTHVTHDRVRCIDSKGFPARVLSGWEIFARPRLLIVWLQPRSVPDPRRSSSIRRAERWRNSRTSDGLDVHEIDRGQSLVPVRVDPTRSIARRRRRTNLLPGTIRFDRG